MSNPIIKIHNAETDEIIEREMTDSEFEQYKKDEARYLKEIRDEKTALENKEKQREALFAKLASLGLDEDDLKALGLG